MSGKSLSLAELAVLVEGEIVGDSEVMIRGFAPLDTVGSGDISFLVKAGLVDILSDFQGSAVIVPMAVEEAPVPLIRVKDPYLASARIHTLLLEKPFLAKGFMSGPGWGRIPLFRKQSLLQPWQLSVSA